MAQEIRDAADAAEDAVAPDRLLEGEDPATTYVEDAALWVSVYGELLRFKRDMIARAERELREGSPETAREIAATDLPVLLAEGERLQRRLAFWEGRLLDLRRR